MTNVTTCEKPSCARWRRKVCACDACRRKYNEVQARYAIRKARGEVDNLPMYEARKLLIRMKNRGVTLPEVEEISGVSRGHLQHILKPRTPAPKDPKYTRYVTSKTAAGIRRAEVETRGRKPVGTGQQRWAYVSAERSARAIQGIMLQGWPQPWIAEELTKILGKGTWTQQRISAIMNEKQPYVYKTTDAGLVKLAKSIGWEQGPSTRTREMAIRRGYKALAEWDDLL